MLSTISRTPSFSQQQQQFVGWIQSIPNAVAMQFLLGPLIIVMYNFTDISKQRHLRYRNIVSIFFITIFITAGLSLCLFSEGYRAIIELVLPGAFEATGAALAFAYYAGSWVLVYPLTALSVFLIKYYSKRKYGDVDYILYNQRIRELLEAHPRLNEVDREWIMEVFASLVNRFRENIPSLFNNRPENLAAILNTIMNARDLGTARRELAIQHKKFIYYLWSSGEGHASDLFSTDKIAALASQYSVSVDMVTTVLEHCLTRLRTSVDNPSDDVNNTPIQCAEILYNILENTKTHKRSFFFYLWAHSEFTAVDLFHGQTIEKLVEAYQVEEANVRAVLSYCLQCLRDSVNKPSADINHTPDQHADVIYTMLHDPELGREKFLQNYNLILTKKCKMLSD